jgi:hypothetical protein
MTDKLENLHNFLRGNVVSPSTPKVITLFDFEFNWEKFQGSFSLKLDSDVMKDRFGFQVEIDEKNNINTYLTHEVRINRITGEWVDHWFHDRKYKDGTWSKERIFKSGKCESGQPKF